MANLTDKTGASVSVELNEELGAYTVSLEGVGVVGRSFYTSSPESESERIFYHTEVDEEYGGRGLGGILLRQSIDHAAADGLTIVPVCPLYVNFFAKSGEEFEAAGGKFRKATSADIQKVREIS